MHFIDQPPIFHVFCKETALLPLTAANVGCRELEGRQENTGKRPQKNILYLIIVYSSSYSSFPHLCLRSEFLLSMFSGIVFLLSIFLSPLWVVTCRMSSLHFSFGFPNFRRAPTSIFYVLVITSSCVCLSTCLNHLSLASLVADWCLPHLPLLVLIMSWSSQSSAFPWSISTFSYLFFLASLARLFSEPMYPSHTLEQVWWRATIILPRWARWAYSCRMLFLTFPTTFQLPIDVSLLLRSHRSHW